MKSFSQHDEIEEKKPINHGSNVSVGKDNDGLLASMSIETCLNIPENAKNIYNSKDDKEFDHMNTACVDLLIHLYKKYPERLKNIDSSEINELMREEKSNNVKDEFLVQIMQKCVNNNFNLKNFGAGRAYDCYLAFKLNIPRHNPITLSPQWEAVSQKYHMPKQLASNYQNTVLEEKNVIGFRLDLKMDAVLKRPSAAKPSYIWLKVGNWAVFRDKIPVDQENFGKTNSSGEVIPGIQTKQTKNPEKYPDDIKIQTMRYTFQELIKGVHDGTYIIDRNLSDEN